MHGPEGAAVRRPRHHRGAMLFAFSAAASLLMGPGPAFGQVDYTGVPPAPPADDVYVVETYVGTYAGNPPAVASQVAAGVRPLGPPPLGGSGGTMSVASAALGEGPEAAIEGDRRLVTGWDVVTMTALGLTAVVAFAVSAARFRSP